MGDEKPGSFIVLGEERDFDLGSAHVSPSRRSVRTGGRDYQLEPRVMQVLVALHRADGVVVSREQLNQLCWAGHPVGDDSLNSAISKLRRIADESSAFDLETVRGIGYRLTSEAMARNGPAGRWLRPGALLALVLLAALFGAWRKFQGHHSASPRVIAVLPFNDFSPSHAGGGSAAITEEIITRLAEEPTLRVIGSSSAAILGSRATAEDARRRLSASHVVEGSYQRRGHAARIAIRLIETETGMVLWAETLDGAAGDLSLLQEEIASQIAGRLRHASPVLADRSSARRTSLQVYDIYLEALALQRRQTAPAEKQSIDLLRRATTLDPNFAPASARLATSLRFLHGPLPSGPARSEALRYARRALNLAPQSGYANAAMGAVLENEQEWPQAIPYLQRAVAIDPSNYPAWEMLGHIQFYHQCRPAAAVASYRRALAVEPLMASLHADTVSILAEMGRFRDAEQLAARFQGATPNQTHTPKLWASIYQYSGDLSRSVELYREAVRRDPTAPDGTLVQLYRPLRMIDDAAATRSVRQSPEIAMALRGDYRRIAQTVTGLGDKIWKLRWEYLAHATTALLRSGRSDWLVQSLDRNYRSVDELNAELGCRQAGAFLPHLVLALRREGRSADADSLLTHARNRFDEARRNGFGGGAWLAVEARLLVLEGKRPAAIRAFRSAVRAGWLDQFWPYISATDPIFDVLATDRAFQTLLAEQRQQQRRERQELLERLARPS